MSNTIINLNIKNITIGNSIAFFSCNGKKIWSNP